MTLECRRKHGVTPPGSGRRPVQLAEGWSLVARRSAWCLGSAPAVGCGAGPFRSHDHRDASGRLASPLVGLLKPLADGLIAAVHAYGSPVDDAILHRAPMIDPTLTGEVLRSLLIEPATAPLGCWRFVTPYRDGVMVSPADDRMVALDIRINQQRRPGAVTAEVVEVSSRALP